MKRHTMRAGFSCVALLAAAACAEEAEDGKTDTPPMVPDEIRDNTAPVIADVRPPPLSGGTLLITNDGTAVAADPDRDRVMLVQIPAGEPREVLLSPGDEPGRSVEDALGRVHVALRRGGAIATIDLATGAVVARREVCGAPRGIAYDAAADFLHVACAGGELVSLSASDLVAPPVATRIIQPDLRDVVVAGDRLLVSTLRGAQVLSISLAGAPTVTMQPAPSTSNDFEGNLVNFAPSVGWRMIPTGDGTALMAHAMAQTDPIDMDDEMGTAYMGGGPSLVRSELSVITSGALDQLRVPDLEFTSLPVDLARSASTGRVAVLDPLHGVFEYDATRLGIDAAIGIGFTEGASAIAYAPNGLLVVQSREPAGLSMLENGVVISAIELGGAPRVDTGFELFHGQGSAMSASGLACASCHPEGREDGHVWQFSDVGARRTQSLAGTLAGTAPFHWEGDLATLEALLDEVMMRRMGALPQSAERTDALRTWLESIPPVHTAPALASGTGDVERGRALFGSEETLCTSCHSGPSQTNATTVYVGTGVALQVPSLAGLGTRAPYMHDGCAATLFDRFRPECGGGDMHGFTSHLGEADIRDLVAYMLTL
ncbi:MAG: c-type cytochrome [Polyangiaceae bacterium]|nr:c-type cytochrome [Polyangiaceae bacterium]